MSTLDGVRAVITGSTRGLGAATAREFVAAGARVVVNGTDAARCADLADELAGVGVAGSVADEAVAEALIATCVEAYGGVDVLINNAGFTRDRMLSRMTAEEFDDVVAVHLRGAWLASRAAARAMKGSGGAIVNIVSGTALYGHPGQSNYAAAKGGVLAMTRALSLELRRIGVRVNALSPIALTDMIAPMFEVARDAAEALRPFFGAPEDVAQALVFLASPAAADLTGQVLGFDGRRLSVWSHPTVLRAVDRDGAWTTDQFAEAIAAGELSALSPDALGQAVQSG